MKDLIHIVASGARNYKDLEDSGNNWLEYFVKNRLIKEGYRVLDFGAGLGRISIPFNKVANVIAVDGNPKMVQFLKDNNIEAFLDTNCERFIGKEKFDFVVSSYVLQHIHFPEAQEIVRQISEITDKFYFTYPIIDLYDEPTYVHYTKSKKVGLLDSHDVSRKISLADLPKLFETSKFKPETIKKHFSNLFEISK